MGSCWPRPARGPANLLTSIQSLYINNWSVSYEARSGLVEIRPMAAGQAKWKRRSEARPDEILDAALDVFNEAGFDAARVEDIAAAAGLSKAAVYLYFPSKADLLRALIEREIAPIARKARELADAGADDPAGTIGGIVAGFSQVMSDPRMFAIPRIVISVSGRFPELADYYRENVVGEAMAAIMALHRAGVERGRFREADSRLVAKSIAGPMLINGLWLHVLRGEPDGLTAVERAQAQVDILMNGLAA